MVRVFRCHRFVTQRVISTACEPTVICADGDRLFAACDNYTIEEFQLEKNGCRKIQQFAAISRILQMVYSHQGEFLATLEEDIVKSAACRLPCDVTFRVYSNLKAASKGCPMKMRIAGQVKRAKVRRTGDMGNTDQLVVIEVPLKRAPSCIAVYSQHIAIAVKRSVLVYTYERVSDTSQDVRCLLELEFAFNVRKIDLCEEFIMCSSGTECQIVRLNFDRSVRSLHSTSGTFNVQSFFEHRALRSSSNLQDDDRRSPKSMGCRTDVSPKECEVCRLKAEGNTSTLCEHCQKANLIVGTERYEKNLNSFNVETEKVNGVMNKPGDVARVTLESSLKRPLVRQTPVSCCFSDPPSAPMPRRKPEYKETAGGGLELLGPVPGDWHICAVYVEYEGTSRNGNGRTGILDKGVTTLLYKKLEPSARPIHSIQLLPIFLDEATSSDRSASGDNVFLSAKRGRLVGMYGIVSTATYAYIYSLLSDCRLISSFSYALETIQVRLTGNHLFAMSESRLDVYSCRSQSRIIFDLEENSNEMLQTMPFISDEPCLLGYHTFLDLTSMCQTGDYVTLLSKSPCFPRSSDNCWSVYILHRPEVSSLYNDMMEHAYDWEKANPARTSSNEYDGDLLSVSLCLIQEANMLLRSHLYLQQMSEKKKELISLLKESSLHLAHYYQSSETNGHIAVAYYLMAGYSLMDIVKSIQHPKAKVSSRCREALVRYARKLTDSRTTSGIVDELAKSGIVNGCLTKLQAIAAYNDTDSKKLLQTMQTDSSTSEVDKVTEASFFCSSHQPGFCDELNQCRS